MHTLADAQRDLEAARLAVRKQKTKVALSMLVSVLAFALALWSRRLGPGSVAPPVAVIVGLLSLGFALVNAPYVRRFSAIADDIDTAIRSGKVK